ncbi:MAG: hypothetical protein QOJ02_2267 [Acidobacteriota bacterium]|jgi:predicted nuclease with TOPRIM domain|nr:hypothetical protein [Acidobacteriota bacterium]
MADDTYKKAFDEAVEELSKVMSQREELEIELEQVDQRIKKLSRSIHGLGELFDPYAVAKLTEKRPELFPRRTVTKDAGFTDAIRKVLMESLGTAYTAIEVRDALERDGFDISKYKNVLASIHAILKRLVNQGQVETNSDEGKVEYSWKMKRGIRI